MAKKKKTIEKVQYVLDEDCKSCVRKVMAHSPLMQDLYQAKTYTLVSTIGSIPYLMNMTDIIEAGINKTFGKEASKRQQKVFDEYFSDIKAILEMFRRMKDGTKTTDRKTAIQPY